MSEYFFTSLSAHWGNIATKESPKPRRCPTLISNDFKDSLKCTVGLPKEVLYTPCIWTVLEPCICTTTMTNIQPDRDSNQLFIYTCIQRNPLSLQLADLCLDFPWELDAHSNVSYIFRYGILSRVLHLPALLDNILWTTCMHHVGYFQYN